MSSTFSLYSADADEDIDVFEAPDVFDGPRLNFSPLPVAYIVRDSHVSIFPSVSREGPGSPTGASKGLCFFLADPQVLCRHIPSSFDLIECIFYQMWCLLCWLAASIQNKEPHAQSLVIPTCVSHYPALLILVG